MLAAIEGESAHLHRGLPWAAPEATGEVLARADVPAAAWLPPCQPDCATGHEQPIPAAPSELGQWGADPVRAEKPILFALKSSPRSR